MSVHEVRIKPIDPRFDVEGRKALEKVGDTDGVLGIGTTTVYWLEGISEADARILARRVLSNPLTESYEVNGMRTPQGDGHIVQIGYRPEMTDPQLQVLRKVASLHGIDLPAASSSRIYTFQNGSLTPDEVQSATKSLYNATTERVITEKPDTLIIKGDNLPGEIVPVRGLSTEGLRSLSNNIGIFLDDDQMSAIQEEYIILGREPTMGELQTFGAGWSDHCVHTTTNAEIFMDGEPQMPLFKMIKSTAKKHFKGKVVSAFDDNAGFYEFYDGKVINAKGETHIYPSSQDPVGGTETGLGGVLRDNNEAGQGAQVILSRDHYGIARLDLPASEIPEGCLSPMTIMRGVVKGAGGYGNPIGVPNFLGDVNFDNEFVARPTVLVVSYGITDREKARKGHPKPADLVLVIGGKTGNDGIHGATGSSVEMRGQTAKTLSTSVQIGNPLEEKRMFDGVWDLSKVGVIRAITDCGAAGLASGVGEMGKETGVRVNLKDLHLKTEGLEGWKKWLSESQERAVVAIDPQHLDQALEILRRRNVEAVVLGEFTNDKRLVVLDGEEKLVDLSYDFLENKLPTQKFEAKWVKPERNETEPGVPADWNQVVEAIFSDYDVASKEEIQRRYDYGVQGTTVLAPFTGVNRDCPNDAVIKAPLIGKPYGVVEAAAKNPYLSNIDPYQASINVSALAMARFVAHGGNPNEAYWINNYISGKVRTPEMMGLMYRCVQGVCDSMDIFDTPVISGKDSFSSSYIHKNGKTQHVLPYVAISVSGPIPDVEKTVSSDIKQVGSTLVLVGQQDQSLGGSLYYKTQGIVGSELPKTDGVVVNQVLDSVHQAIQTGKVMSSKAVAEGGVIRTIGEMCFGGDCGIEVSLPDGTERPDTILFNETPGTFVIEVANSQEAEELFGNVPHVVLGHTNSNKQLKVNSDNQTLFELSTDRLKHVWKEPFGRIFR